jgi:hypothetical protein
MPVALQVQLTSADFRDAFLQLKSAGGNFPIELRRGVNACVAPLVNGVREEASWSSRIPDAVRAKTSFAAKKAGVSVIVDAREAPEARPLNHSDQGGTFRHPVFGNRDVWRAQAAHPFFAAGIAKAGVQVQTAISNVITTIQREAGFR